MMRKKWWLFISLVLSAILFAAILAFSASAETVGGDCGAEGDNLKWSLDTGTGVLTITGEGEMETYSSALFAPWYSYPSSIQSVILPEGLTSIGAYAFKDSTNLTSITIPSSVKSIGDYAFNNCSGLTDVTFAENSQCTSIGTSAFSYCTNLTSITIPSSVKSIGDNAFSNCSGLTDVTFAENSQCTGIGSGVFNGCNIQNAAMPMNAIASITTKNNLQTVVINGGESIGSYAFSGCKNLTSVSIFPSVQSIASSAFNGCSGLTSVTFVGNSQCTSIDSYTFVDCAKLVSITIPSSVKSIGDYAFYNCSGLTSVTFAKNSQCTSIGTYAFGYCTSLASITVPSSVQKVENYAFEGCSGMTSAMFAENSQCTSIGYSVFSGCSSLESVTIPFVGASAGVTASDTYQFPLGYIFGSSSYDGGVATKQTFYNMYTSVTGSATYCIPASLQSVTVMGGNLLFGAFWDCAGLMNITILSSAQSIGTCVFHGCTGLTNIMIPASVQSIVPSAFEGCTGLTSITVAPGNTVYHSTGNCLIETESKTLVFGCKNSIIPTDGSVTSIGSNAFRGCTGLTGITIPSSVQSIEFYAFADCSGLKSVTFAKNSQCTSIGDCVFRDCTSLTSITIPSSVQSIGGDAFLRCSGLTSVTFEEDSQCTSIGGSAFTYCTKLTSIKIPSSVKRIERYTFRGCSGLTSVTFAENSQCTYIGDSAFYSCTNLKSITILSSAQSIEFYAFADCSGLACIYLDSSAIAVDLYSATSCGLLSQYAKTVSVLDGITKVNSYITNNFTYTEDVTHGGKLYHVYADHTHVWGDAVTVGENKIHICSECGLEKDKVKENYTVSLTSRTVAEADGITNVTGAGKYVEGTSVTVTAARVNGYRFLGWYVGTAGSYADTPVSDKLSYTFTLSADTSLVAVFEKYGEISLEIAGSNVKVNDKAQCSSSYRGNHAAADVVKVEYTGDGQFLYWKDQNGKIVSENKEYVFVITDATVLTPVYILPYDDEDVFALVEFLNDYGQVLASGTFYGEMGESIPFPDAPSKTGYQFENWNKTEQEIIADILGGSKHIRVTPVYIRLEQTYSVTVNADGEKDVTDGLYIGDTFSAIAPEIDGKTFGYWANENGVILSYQPEYRFRVTGSVTLTAHYTDAAAPIEKMPVIVITDIAADDANGKPTLHISLMRDVPDGYTVLSYGMLYTAEVSKATADGMTLSSDVKRTSGTTTSSSGTYILNLGVRGKEDVTVYMRGYLTVRNEETGNTEMIYTDIVSTSYENETAPFPSGCDPVAPDKKWNLLALIPEKRSYHNV